jgi:hypothetical protein
MKYNQLATISILFILMGCNSTKILFTSTDEDKKNYWTVNAFIMSHCGCTQLVVEKYRKGKNEFQIMYTDDMASKNIYGYSEKGLISDTTILIASVDRVDIPFDSLDREIFQKIKTIIDTKDRLVYAMKWTEYKGYKRID